MNILIDSSIGINKACCDYEKSNLVNVSANYHAYDINQVLSHTSILREEAEVLFSIDAAQRKQKGIFFTPANLAKLSALRIGHTAYDGAILDPACGTGNLLVEVAAAFAICPDLEETLTSWNEKFYGLDINAKFIDIAKKKIIRLALDKGATPRLHVNVDYLMSLLTNIKVGDFLFEYRSYIGFVRSIIMNPPFCHLIAPQSINWTSGRLNAAALFVHYACEILPAGGRILGILPDVLQSGTRYNHWRSHIQALLSYSIEPFGNFQRGVQVDVFIMLGTKREYGTNISDVPCLVTGHSNLTIMDYFDISVGPVVPHRDKATGAEFPYAHARILPPWETITLLPERIAHASRKFSPPFVAIRRTSSPKDKYRAVGTIVNCLEQVSVENHIIVLAPKDKTLESCQSLLKYLMSEKVNNYINSKIRCRHLTVGVVKGIPLEKDDYGE